MTGTVDLYVDRAVCLSCLGGTFEEKELFFRGCRVRGKVWGYIVIIISIVRSRQE